MNLLDIDDQELKPEVNREELTREEKARLAARKNRRRKTNLFIFSVVTGSLVLMVAICYGGIMMQKKIEEQPASSDRVIAQAGDAQQAISTEVMYSQAELDARIAEAVQTEGSREAERILGGIRESLSQGSSTLETLRPFYPDELIVVSGGKFHFVPINRELKLNSYSMENLEILENGEYRYLEEGQVISHKGIDVSSYQGKIDWKKVAGDGVEFAMIRVGFRGYGEAGRLVEDECFEANVEGALAAGIKVGVYFFSQAITPEEIEEEAELVLRKIAPYKIECPVVFDVERVSAANGRMNKISLEERTNLTLQFLQIIEEHGYTPMLYHNTEMGALMIDIATFEDYDKWYASYSDTMFYPYEYKIWQYSDKGKVNGISSAVDMNISFAPVW